MNPEDFVITRRRKKYKFAKFFNAKNCFEFAEWQKPPVDVIEIGAGTGLFSVELASRHPEKNFVAVDVKADRLQKGAYEALDRKIENVIFLRARADELMQIFDAASLVQIWLTFPDPFPRVRSERRRLTHANFLRQYATLLCSKGSLFIKHDNVDFFHWSLEQLVSEQWHIDELSFDLHDSELPEDYKILTTYEQRWLKEGLTTNFLKASHA